MPRSGATKQFRNNKKLRAFIYLIEVDKSQERGKERLRNGRYTKIKYARCG